MPFQSGNKYGGKRANAGRPSKKQVIEELTAAQKAREYLERNVDKVMGCYLGLAGSGQDPATTRHFVDKILPDDQQLDHAQTINIAIAPQVSREKPGPEPQLRAGGLQIRVGGHNGKDRNGGDGA